TLYPEDEPATYVASPGFQVQIVAKTTGVSVGRDVSLYIDGAKIREEKVFDGEATFQEITMPASTDAGYSVRLEVTTQDGETVESEKTVVVSVDTCDVVISPASDAGCLITDDSDVAPGFQVRFLVTHTGGKCTDAAVSVELGGVTFPESPNTKALDDNGEAEFFITLSEDLDSVPITVTADVTHPTSTGLNASLSAEYTLDNSAPTVSFTLPNLELTPELDLITDKDGDATNGIQQDVQLAVTGLSETDIDSVVFSVDQAPVGDPGTPGAGSQVLFSDVTFDQQGSVNLSAVGTDACGNQGSASLDIPVYSTVPALMIVSPADGTTLLAADDIDKLTATTYETQFQVQATGVVAN
ncbi:MAG: hypothetical protein VX938_00310, partial [Myxococcota bacterium]|nr:hypothetical protein [Myxococcota bacterium]